jgi:hypothetical protein
LEEGEEAAGSGEWGEAEVGGGGLKGGNGRERWARDHVGRRWTPRGRDACGHGALSGSGVAESGIGLGNWGREV